jgi:hypothetical protein
MPNFKPEFIYEKHFQSHTNDKADYLADAAGSAWAAVGTSITSSTKLIQNFLTAPSAMSAIAPAHEAVDTSAEVSDFSAMLGYGIKCFSVALLLFCAYNCKSLSAQLRSLNLFAKKSDVIKKNDEAPDPEVVRTLLKY